MFTLNRSFIWLGRVEGLSTLALFFVAMPLKYLAGQPEAVRWVGSIHGGLFLGYIALAFAIADRMNWPRKTLAACLVLSSLPFGTFYFEKFFISKIDSNQNQT